MKEYTYLAGAIVTEVIGTSALKLSNGFEHAALGGLAIALYVVSFYFVSQALTFLPVGLVYATWSAVGIVGLAAIGIVFFDETVDLAAVVGFVLVIAGVVLLNVYSSAYNPA
ncbi:multidrug efflux SMR transporter [Natrialba sp. INN-245]|uniref:DMT family transporter n=1 Tax=Natrialba sp. INN-245 TaxID=2690967 RepID=UPI001312BA24|nr:multidrug efflux SMR transporter [Natrialba sp. INN-245]MWV40370.1 QacE family quaternary ammonium compound efflux SMR transporter [Natrialba sp. INN-245]